MKKIVIKTDEQAIEILDQALKNELDENVVVEFDGWPTIDVKYVGPKFNSSVTSSNAEALIEIQKAVNNAYTLLVKNSSGRLTDGERKALECVTFVSQGSSEQKTDLADAVKTIGNKLAGKMSGRQIAIVLITLGLAAGSVLVAKDFIANEAKTKQVSLQVQLSEQETKRMEIVTDALSTSPKLRLIKDDFDGARKEILKSATEATSVTLDGTSLTGADAKKIVRNTRVSSKDIQLNGVYTIGGVYWRQDDQVMLDLRSNEKTLEFRASLDAKSLMRRDRDLLARAEWERIPVYLSINAKKSKNGIFSARVVGFDWDRIKNK